MIRQLPAEQNFLLDGIDWDTYVAFSDRLGKRSIRLNYDGVNLELMTLSPEHEHAKKRLACLLEMLAVEMDVDFSPFGSMTCRREDLKRGFEPDECYWITHESQVRGRDHIDLTRDPPPDLMLEVEISRSFVDRLAIAARLGVPEVWRWDGESMRVMLLGRDGQYTETERSLALPFLLVAELVPFLNPELAQSETKLLQAFRDWVRARKASGWSSATP